MFYVYILKSIKDKNHYIGYSENLLKRIAEHNRGKSPSVKARAPFVLVHQEAFLTKEEAIRREKQIKAFKGGNAFKQLIHASSAPPKAGLGSLSNPAV